MRGFLDDSVRFRYIFEVAGSLISLGRHTEISPVIKKHYKKISERLEIIAYIAEKLAPEDRETALEILELGLIDSETVEITFADRADIFAYIAAVQIQTGHIEKAIESAKHLAREKPDLYSEIIGESVAKLPNPSQAQSLLIEVLEFVDSIPDDPDQTVYLERQTVLNYLVGALARRNQFEYAITVISRMDDNFWQKPLAFAELAGRLAAIDKKGAETFLNHAIKIIRKHGGTRGKKSSGYSFLIPEILPLFLAPANAQLGKWIMLSPKVGPLGELVDIEEGTGMSFIATELLIAGWVEKALEIIKTLKVESIRLQIRTYAAILVADQGDIGEAHKLLGGNYHANPAVDHLKALGYETSDPKMILRTTEFERLVRLGDVNEAQNIARELIDDADANIKGKVFGVLALVLSVNDYVDETIDLLKSIPNEFADKIQVQIACMMYFLNEKNYSVAEKIADIVEVVSWKTMFRTLIETIKTGSDDQEQLQRSLTRFINNATEVEQLTESDAIKTWLSKQAADGLTMLGELKEVLTIVYGISNLDFRYRTMSEVSARLVKRGLIEDAYQIFREIGDQKIRDTTVTLIVSELETLNPIEAMHGFYTFLRDSIDAGFKSTCHAISEVIPLIVKLGDPDHAAELLWEAQKEILRVDSFWDRKVIPR